MIIANTSFHVTAPREAEFHAWVEKAFLPMAQKAACVTDSIFMRILTDIDPNVSAYAIQLRADDLEPIEDWMHSEGARALKFLSSKMGQECVYFTTYLETIDD